MYCSVYQHDGICTINETLGRVLEASMGKHCRVRVDAATDDILHSPSCEKQAGEQCGGPKRSESTEEQKMLAQRQGVWDGGVEKGGRETQAVTIDCLPQDLSWDNAGECGDALGAGNST